MPLELARMQAERLFEVIARSKTGIYAHVVEAVSPAHAKRLAMPTLKLLAHGRKIEDVTVRRY